MTHDPYAPPKADSAEASYSSRVGLSLMGDAEAEQIRRRLQAMNRTSLVLGGPGLLLQGVGNAMHGLVGGLASLVGIALLIAGLSVYARMRGHSPWLGALGLLSCIGMVVLVLLPRKCFNCQATVKGTTCTACGAPAPP